MVWLEKHRPDILEPTVDLQIDLEDRTQLRESLAGYSWPSLRTLAFDLDIDFSEVRYRSKDKDEFAIHLITFLEQRRRLKLLVDKMLDRRRDPFLERLSAELPDCIPRKKFETLFTGRMDQLDIQELKRKLAAYCDVHGDQVSLVAIAGGSLRLLVGVPQTVRLLRVAWRMLALGESDFRFTSIRSYESLPKVKRATWRSIASHPPQVEHGIVVSRPASWARQLSIKRAARLERAWRRLLAPFWNLWERWWGHLQDWGEFWRDLLECKWLRAMRERLVPEIMLVAASVVALLGLVIPTAGVLLNWARKSLLLAFGWGAYVLPIAGIFVGVLSSLLKLLGRHPVLWRLSVGGMITFLSSLGLVHLVAVEGDPWLAALTGNGGGYVGAALSTALVTQLGPWGAGLVLVTVGAVGIRIALGPIARDRQG